MRKVLLTIAAMGLMAAFAGALSAQGYDEGQDGGNGGGPGNPPPPHPVDHGGGPTNPDPIPGGTPPGGIPSWGGGTSQGGGWGGWPGEPPVPQQPGIPTVPVAPPPPPPPPPPAPPIPPGGSTPGVPTAPGNSGGGNGTVPTIPGGNGGMVSNNGGAGRVGPNQPTMPGTTVPVVGTGSSSSGLACKDFNNRSTVDRPVGTVHINLGLANGNGNGNGGSGPVGNPMDGTCDLPPEPPVGEDPPTFYGEPVQGKFVFVLDASGSMAGARIASLRAEATNTLGALTDTDEFDCMSYGTQFGDSTMELWGGLMPATDSNRNDAINFVNGPACNPGGGTPTHRALEKACQMYSELDKMFLLTDGAPNATGSASQILAHFPAWWAAYPQETTLVCICIGGIGEAVNFMRDLSAIDDNGVFINKP